MKRDFNVGRELQLLTTYGSMFPVDRASFISSHLRCACRAFRLVRSDDTLLNHAHTTEWVIPWRNVQKGISPAVLAIRLQLVRRWLSWAFDIGELDDNALAYASAKRLVSGKESGIELRCNLQRAIATLLLERGPRRESQRREHSCYLNGFNVFVNRRLEHGARSPEITLEVLLDWMRAIGSRCSMTTTVRAVGLVNSLLDLLHETGRLASQPLAEFLNRYPHQSRRQFLRAVLATPPNETLPVPSVPPRFVSALAPHFEGYLKLMRAVGRRYDRIEYILRELDRFVAQEPAGEVVLTRDLVGRWLESKPHLARSTQSGHVSVARRFCRYVARFEPLTWIPDRSLDPARLSRPRPNVLSVSEVRSLLAAALRIRCHRWPLMPHTLHTLLLMLYGTGLRVSEALRLRIRDVNLDGRTLWVDKSKFFKSRWVPFSNSLADQLRVYLVARSETSMVVRPDDPFFINALRRCHTYSQVGGSFRRIVRETDVVVGSDFGRRPRLHDLRRTFAVHCVLRWYREGADVQAKLPLLATYLGHTNILATHIYLKATAEVLGHASERFESAYSSLLNTESEKPDDTRRRSLGAAPADLLSPVSDRTAQCQSAYSPGIS